MQKAIFTFVSILFLQSSYGQHLDHYIPSVIKHSDETIIYQDVEEIATSNAESNLRVTYYKTGIPKASVKAAVYDHSAPDFDEKEFKNSMGFELLDIGLIELHRIPFPIYEFDDDGHHRYMTQFSIVVKDHKTYEIQNFFNLDKYAQNTRQLRYIISSSDWGAIMEILSYFFHQTYTAGIEVISSSTPLERVFVEEFDFSGTEGYVVAFAVGQKTEELNIHSEIRTNATIETSMNHVVGSRGSDLVKVNNLPANKSYQRITITDKNKTIILDHILKKEKDIGIPTIEEPSEENSTPEAEEFHRPGEGEFSVFPSIFSNQISVLINNKSMDANQLKTIALLNQTGEVVKIIKTYDNEIILDASMLNRGLYFIKWLDGNSSSSRIISKM